MTRGRDIHKIDNALIRLGWVAFVVAAIAIFVSFNTTDYRIEHADGRIEHRSSSEDAETMRRINAGADVTALSSGPGVYWLSTFAAAVLMLGVGYYVRAQENRALMVWDILERMAEVRADELAASTGLTRETLRRVVALINTQPGAFFVWSSETDMIVDGRLRQRVVHVERCTSCGATVNATLSLDLLQAPVCDFCASPVSSNEELKARRQELLEEIRAQAGGSDKGFSVLIFVLLLIFFWPAALGYAVWKSGVLDQMLGKSRPAGGHRA